MLYAIIAAIVLVADQWLKYWVTVNITLATGEISLIPGVIKLVNIHNSGAAFGLLDKVPAARWIFLGIAALFVAAVIVLLVKRVFKSRFANWCAVLAMAGAVGNCIDRLLYGYVVDMFKLEFMNFAIFNVADIILVISCLLFIVALFTTERDEVEYDEDEEEGSSAEDEPVEVTAEESKAPEAPKVKPVAEDNADDDDDFWAALDAVPKASAKKSAAPKVKPEAPKVKPETPKVQPEAPKKAALVEEEFDLESIMAEFKDI